MKIARSIIVFLIASVLLSCSVFAVDDLFNTSGEVTKDTVYGGIRFEVPDYYVLDKEDSVSSNFSYDDLHLSLGSYSTDVLTKKGFDIDDEEGMKNTVDKMIQNTTGFFATINKQSFSQATIAGNDSMTGYAETNKFKYYLTLTKVPSFNAVVITGFSVPLKMEDASQYETDYANMLKNAYIDDSVQPAAEQQTTEEQSTTQEEKKSGTDWEKYGDAWSNIGDAFESLENDDIGGAFDALGDAYQKLGEFAE